MKRFGLFLVLILLMLSAGCTQSQPATIPQPDVTLAQVTQPPAPVPTTATMGTGTKAPVETVTVVHYIEDEKAWKDSQLHIAFKAPQSWKITTRQMTTPDGSQGLEFQTDLVSNDIFTIRTFPISLNQDQAFRDTFRKWDPKPTESTVTINTIVYDRFESTKNNITRIGYVARKSSANDIGFSSVLSFTADGSRPFEKEDFENVVGSFAYFTKDQAVTMQGEEIPRVR